MTQSNWKLRIANIITTIIVIVLPLLNLQQSVSIIEQLTPIEETDNLTPFVVVGIIFSGIISIFILFYLFKLVCTFLKIHIHSQLLYFILITAKLIAGFIHRLLLDFQLPSTDLIATIEKLMFVRELIFYGTFCALLYFYFHRFHRYKLNQLVPTYVVILVVLALLNATWFLEW